MRQKIAGNAAGSVRNLEHYVDIVIILDGKGFKFSLILGKAGAKIGDGRGILFPDYV